MENVIRTGSVVYSKRGRDAGGFFAVVGITDADFVLIADGQTHKLNHPKKKNIKHLKCDGQILESISEKLLAGKKVFDSELRSALRSFNDEARQENSNNEQGGKYVER